MIIVNNKNHSLEKCYSVDAIDKLLILLLYSMGSQINKEVEPLTWYIQFW